MGDETRALRRVLACCLAGLLAACDDPVPPPPPLRAAEVPPRAVAPDPPSPPAPVAPAPPPVAPKAPDGITPGTPRVSHGLSRDQVDDVVLPHLGPILYCYRREWAFDANLAGRIVVKFVIAPEGAVASLTIASTTMHQEVVESCVARRFLNMHFPEPSGGGTVTVSYPFVFSPP